MSAQICGIREERLNEQGLTERRQKSVLLWLCVTWQHLTVNV